VRARRHSAAHVALRVDFASLPCAEAAQRFQALRSEMTGIAQKIGEIESEGEEHR
jgi:hypothetical protein